MSNLENLKERKKSLAKQLRKVKLPDTKESVTCWLVGSKLGCSGVTIKNYLSGNVADGYLGEAILEVFEELNDIINE
jgi:hypothetical protein